MPIIYVELFEGRTTEQKRAFVKAVTDIASTTLGGSRESVQIIFTDVAKENWAIGGELHADKQIK